MFSMKGLFFNIPVLNILQVEFRVAGKQIDLERKNCKLRDGTWVSCVDIDVSMSYDGIGVPDFIGMKSIGHICSIAVY